jgi:peptide/nickel transport system permease protein
MPSGFFSRAVRIISKAPWLVRLAAIIVCVLVLMAILAGQLAPSLPETMDLSGRLKAPLPFSGSTWSHLLGTDELGRDLFTRLLYAMRISFLISIAGTVGGAALGVGLGLIAAHFRGIVDDTVLLAIDFNAALPFIVMALAILAFFGSQVFIIIAIMAIYGWDRYARLTRNLTVSALTEGYAFALLSLGASPGRIYLKHILPNIAGVLIVNMTLNFPATILLETSLSFLGVGVQPPLVSLGTLLGFGRDYLTTAWWIAVIPGSVIVMVTLAISVLGDYAVSILDGTYKERKNE